MKYINLTEEQVEMVISYLFNTREPMMIINEDVLSVGDILKIKRVHDGLTQSELARLLKMSTGVLCEIERNVRSVPPRKQKVIDNYIYKTLFMLGRLEFIKGGKTDEQDNFILDLYDIEDDEEPDTYEDSN